MKNLVGKKYGLLTVLAEVERKGKDRRVLVRCDCVLATEKVVYFGNLQRGATTSCGCVHKSISSAVAIALNTTHGLCKHRLYSTWGSMKKRCHDPKHKSYATYGGRGITVCERWQRFENFYADMGPTYKEGLTLDRKDNNKGYDPDNCRWATWSEQGKNRRTNLIATLNGRTQCVTAWCQELGVSINTVRSRLRVGKTPEQALTVSRNTQ